MIDPRIRNRRPVVIAILTALGALLLWYWFAPETPMRAVQRFGEETRDARFTSAQRYLTSESIPIYRMSTRWVNDESARATLKTITWELTGEEINGNAAVVKFKGSATGKTYDIPMKRIDGAWKIDLTDSRFDTYRASILRELHPR